MRAMNGFKAKPPAVRIGAIYTTVNATATAMTWRVERLLSDGIHVVLTSDGEPARRKTVSAWALTNPRYFAPKEE